MKTLIKQATCLIMTMTVDGDITVKDTGTFDTANGSITIAADGEYTYTPDENYNGSDSFEYTIVDDDGCRIYSYS